MGLLDMFDICLDRNLEWKEKPCDDASFTDMCVAIHLE